MGSRAERASGFSIQIELQFEDVGEGLGPPKNEIAARWLVAKTHKGGGL